MFRIVFVLDILNGSAVHAVRGERAKYKPVKSRVCDSSNPLDIISFLKPGEVYVADLNRLQRQGDNFGLIRIISSKAKTMVDVGTEDMDDVEKSLGIADTAILGTETASLAMVESASRRFPGRINVSIDIKNGKVLTKDRRMAVKPIELVKTLNGYNLKDLIILNLDNVGTSRGVDVDFLNKIAGVSVHDVLAGGGVRGMNDIDALREAGLSGALVATAVHNGKIAVEIIQQHRIT